MLAAAGAAAQAHYLGNLASSALRSVTPTTAKLIMPPDNSFFVQWVAFRYNGREIFSTPRLLIGAWELDTGLSVRHNEAMTLDFGPHGGYQLDPGEKISLMGHEGCAASLHGFLIPHGELRGAADSHFVQNPFVPYAYWLRV
jgi:hypothetical protein